MRNAVRHTLAFLLCIGVLAGCTAGQPEAPPAQEQDGGTAAAPGKARRPRRVSDTTPARLKRVKLGVELIAELPEVTAMAVRPGDRRVYTAQRRGMIHVLGGTKPKPVLDWREHTLAGGERGMLGLAFSPDGSKLYISYIGLDADSHVDEFTLNGRVADVTSRRQILFVEQPDVEGATVHKGGQIAFGPDGMFYLALGDGGPSGDPPDTSQALDTLLGKIVRLDIGQGEQAYAIPADNPFKGQADAMPEIYAMGLRNPWRWSFDAKTGDVYVADVGRYETEEINFIPQARLGGANFGWNLVEGTTPLFGDAPEGSVEPLLEYPHGDRCAVIGGYVYRGTRIPGLHGAYVFGDYCDGQIRALLRSGRKVALEQPLGVSVPALSSFGQGPDNELYALSLEKGVYRIVPAGQG